MRRAFRPWGTLRLRGAGEDNSGKQDSRGRNSSTAYIGYIYLRKKQEKWTKKSRLSIQAGKASGWHPKTITQV